jgi:uncharacterized protein (TIGR03086 family)
VTDAADQYRRRAEAFERLVAGTPPSSWGAPSPCEDWTARDVVAHVVDFTAKVLTEEVGVDDPPRLGEGDDPLAVFQAARAIVQGVLDDPATTDELATKLEWSVSWDLPQHGWDLAMATGQDATMDPIDIAILWGPMGSDDPEERAKARLHWQWQIDQGWYGPPVEVPEDAPLQDRVIGFLGRDPYWMPA